ncbi:MAG: YezD family protein [Butyricicoccus sp.]
MNDLELYGLEPAHVQKILDAIHAVRFGTVTVVIQDGVVIQLEQHEKIRLK